MIGSSEQVLYHSCFLGTMLWYQFMHAFFSAEVSATLRKKILERGENEVEENVRSSLFGLFSGLVC